MEYIDNLSQEDLYKVVPSFGLTDEEIMLVRPVSPPPKKRYSDTIWGKLKKYLDEH